MSSTRRSTAEARNFMIPVTKKTKITKKTSDGTEGPVMGRIRG